MKITKKVRSFFADLHEDESAPNTVEWILLVIVALIVLLAIFLISQWVIDKVGEKQDAVEKDKFMTGK